MGSVRAFVMVVVFVVGLAAVACFGEIRIWTDITGKHHVEAELVSVDST
jgi:hypothetical protein